MDFSIEILLYFKTISRSSGQAKTFSLRIYLYIP
jgi:hypothetical protein